MGHCATGIHLCTQLTAHCAVQRQSLVVGVTGRGPQGGVCLWLLQSPKKLL